MPTLSESLHGSDLAHLKIIASLWGIELHAPSAREALSLLVPEILEPEQVRGVVSGLPSDAQVVLGELINAGGRITWPQFTRRYGSIREMGAGRRDREQPFLDPITPVEVLWYRALIARAFFDTPDGPMEFAYIPEDLLPIISFAGRAGLVSLGRTASSYERAHIMLVNDCILDHACTLLAALRVNIPQADQFLDTSISVEALKSLLTCAGLVDGRGFPRPDETRAFLEASRGGALALLANTWLNSSTFNELSLLPNLGMESEWQNDPLRTRQVILDILDLIPAENWWNLELFIESIKESHPDFQRPNGDYDSWFLRDDRTGEFLRGFEHWDDVDGALIRYLITGPMHWLGIMDLAAPAENKSSTAFRFSRWSIDLLAGKSPDGLAEESRSIKLSSNAHFRVPRLAPRALRYQIARFSQWEEVSKDDYTYRLTPASLTRAKEQGLTVKHLLSLLHRHIEALPPSLIKALERWDQNGSEATFEHVLVLRLSTPDVMKKLRKSRAARFLGDPLGTTAIIIKPGAIDKVLAVLAELGYLGEVKISTEDEGV
jgi:hypothetical protein